MLKKTARTGADHPPSTNGTFGERARRWPLRAGIVTLVALGVAAPVVAAEPAAAPKPTPVEVPDASPASALPGSSATGAFRDLGLKAMLGASAASRSADVAVPPAPTTTTTTAPPVTTTTTAPPVTTTTAPPPPPTTAPPAPEPAPAPAAPSTASSSDWDRLAQCESGGNWAINTGNGYYGGLQFSASSWAAVGGSGLPHQHSRETQIAMGERLKAAQGWGAWPSCSAKLGLR